MKDDIQTDPPKNLQIKETDITIEALKKMIDTVTTPIIQTTKMITIDMTKEIKTTVGNKITVDVLMISINGTASVDLIGNNVERIVEIIHIWKRTVLRSQLHLCLGKVLMVSQGHIPPNMMIGKLFSGVHII